MRHKLLKLSALLLLAIMFGPLQGQTTLNVKPTSGTQTAYTLTGIRKLTFPSAGNMIVTKTTAATDNYVLTAVRYLNFSDVSTATEPAAKLQAGFKLYPNPAKDLLNVQWVPADKHAATVELLSIEGKLLYKAQVGGATHTINVSELKQGIYLCRLNNGNAIETTKFFKQ